MPTSTEILISLLRNQFAKVLTHADIVRGEAVVEVATEDLLTVCQALRDDYGFEQLVDLCGVDYVAFGQADWETQSATSTGFSRGVSQGQQGGVTRDEAARFAVVYHLLSLQHNRRLRVRCSLPKDSMKIASVLEIWASANWYEREAFDLFGILFEGHPDLRRILTDYGFIGHPLRKDFPLEGNVEVRYDAEQKRVIYQPVTITNRVLVPRVIRPDNPYEKSAEDKVNDA